MLAFEMDICQDFISFKLFSVLDQPTTIAVVMGGVDYAKILPPKSYIDVSDFKSAKDLSNYLLYLDAHNGKWNNVMSNQYLIQYCVRIPSKYLNQFDEVTFCTFREIYKILYVEVRMECWLQKSYLWDLWKTEWSLWAHFYFGFR